LKAVSATRRKRLKPASAISSGPVEHVSVLLRPREAVAGSEGLNELLLDLEHSGWAVRLSQCEGLFGAK
jgi:hypothetical protein